MTAPLEIQNLTKDYGSLRAVDKVSFALEPGEIFGLLGPNGAGKTSIISTIVTIEKPTSGQVKVFGHDVTKAPRAAKSKVGYVPQEIVNHGYFDVEEVIRFYAGFFGVRVESKDLKELLQRLQLWEHRHKKVKQLSGGMKRRLLIAKALIHKPEILLLDEPTAGVDIELRETLWEFVRELQSQGMTILLTTHYLEEAEMLCERVGILSKGKLMRVGPTNELVGDLTQREIRLELKEDHSEVHHPMLVEQTRRELTFRVPPSKGVGDLLMDLSLDVRSVVDIRINEGNLEDAFRSVLGGTSIEN